MAVFISPLANDLYPTGAPYSGDVAGIASRDQNGRIATPERDCLQAEAEQQARNVLNGCLGGLTDKHHDVLVLRYWHDLNFTEIGVVMGCTESAARRLHDRAKRCLRLSLDLCDFTAADVPV